MFCRICGTRIAEGAMFCHKCGTKVAADTKNTTSELNAKDLKDIDLFVTFASDSFSNSPVMNSQESEVLVDGEKIGHLPYGKTIAHKITPGQHHITAGLIDVWIDAPEGSGPVRLTIQSIAKEEGVSEYQLICEPSHLVIPNPSDNSEILGGLAHCGIFDSLAGEAEEPKFNAILSKVGLDKVHTVKAVREWTGIESKEAEELFEQVPVLLKKAVTLKEAKEIRAVFAKERAEITFTDSKGRSVDIDREEGCDNGKKRTWIERVFGDMLKLPVFWRWFLGIGFFVSCGFLIVVCFDLLLRLLQLIFSSFINMIIAAAVGYILYHKGIAEVITEFIYKRESKVLRLPEGMSVSMLLEALSGKFNYPYFKGVHYGTNGECVIEGKYSMYPVIFKKYNFVEIDYISKENEKRKRTVLLEAMTIRDYINKFFNPNLSIDVVEDMKRLRLAEGQRKAVAIAWAAASVLIVAAIAWDHFSPGSLLSMAVPGMEVRSAYLSQYSKKVTIEEAFKNYFDKGKWTKYDSQGYTYVAFTGTCKYLGERVDVRIVFKLTGEYFIVDSLDIDGRTQSNFVLSSLLSDVYEDY